jgi:hypothetical protein
MNEQEPMPLETLEIDGKKDELSPEAVAVLEQHHIDIEERATGLRLTFPAGTLMQEIWPRTASERHRIVLADGYELRYLYDRHMQAGHRRILLLNRDR